MRWSDFETKMNDAINKSKDTARTFSTNPTREEDKLLNQMNEGIKALPLIGGFIETRENGAVSISKIRDAVNNAMNKLNNMSTSEAAKLNKVIAQLEEYGTMIGSPSLIAFARSRKEEALKKKNEIEKTMSDIDNAKSQIQSKADDVISAPAKDRYTTSDALQSLARDINNVQGGINNVQEN